MKRIVTLVGIALALFAGPLSADISSSQNPRVTQLYVRNNNQFRVRFSSEGNTWYRVTRSSVGDFRYRQLYSLFLTALNSQNILWVGENSNDIFAATICRPGS